VWWALTLGNRITYEDSRAGLSVAYGPNDMVNQYPTIGGEALAYDANGNLATNEKGYTFVYDHDNHLLEVRAPDSPYAALATYTYDALARRIQEDKGGQVTRFYYDDRHNVIAEYDDAATPELQRYFVHGAGVDEHVLMINVSGADYYYLLGPQNTVLGLTDANGIAAETYQYDTYGTPTSVTGGGTGNPYRFTGRRLDFNEGDPANHDHDLVLYHYRARAYDALHGRFLQRDPIGYAGGSMNLYEYAKSRPGYYVDPSGLQAEGILPPQMIEGAGSMSTQELEERGWFAVTDTMLADFQTLTTDMDLESEERDVIHEEAVVLAIAFCNMGEPDYLVMGQRVALSAGFTTEDLPFLDEQRLFVMGWEMIHQIQQTKLRADIERTERVQNQLLQLLVETTMSMAAGPLIGRLGVATGFVDDVGVNTARAAKTLAGPGEDLYVGTYSKVRYWNKKSGLNATHSPHHAPQDAVSGVSRGRGISINLRKDLHEGTWTNKVGVEPGLTLRQRLARDIKNLRKILREAGYDRSRVNMQLKELARQNTELWQGK